MITIELPGFLQLPSVIACKLYDTEYSLMSLVWWCVFRPECGLQRCILVRRGIPGAKQPSRNRPPYASRVAAVAWLRHFRWRSELLRRFSTPDRELRSRTHRLGARSYGGGGWPRAYGGTCKQALTKGVAELPTRERLRASSKLATPGRRSAWCQKSLPGLFLDENPRRENPNSGTASLPAYRTPRGLSFTIKTRIHVNSNDFA